MAVYPNPCPLELERVPVELKLAKRFGNGALLHTCEIFMISVREAEENAKSLELVTLIQASPLRQVTDIIKENIDAIVDVHERVHRGERRSCCKCLEAALCFLRSMASKGFVEQL